MSEAIKNSSSYVKIVIIGGGNMGVACAYQLAKQGCTDVILLEKSELTSGATWHAAGLVSRMVGALSLGAIHDIAVETYKAIEAETNQAVSWHGCGSLRVATSPAHMDWIKHLYDTILSRGQEAEIVSAEKVKELNPLYDIETARVMGGLYTPDDGHVDPSGVCFAMAKGAKNLGVQISKPCRALDVKQLPSMEWQVTTEQGTIICEHIINAGGYHARQIGAFSGLDLPITSLQHHYIITDNVPELKNIAHEIPVTRDDYFSGYMRREGKESVLIGLYDKQAPQMVWAQGCPWESAHELFNPNWDGITPWVEKCFERFPALMERGIKRVVNGAITYTPDGAMLLGPAPNLRNYWLACGATVGIAWAPGAAHYLAQWILKGNSDISMRGFDPRRFGIWADKDYALKRAMEDYTLRQAMPYPQHQHKECRDLKISGAHEYTKKLGALYEEVAGWERPKLYADFDPLCWRRSENFDVIKQEVLNVRSHVGIGDFSAFAKFTLTGADAAAFLNHICANKIPQKINGTSLTAILNQQAYFEGEAVIVKTGDETFYVITGAPSGRRIWDWLEANRTNYSNFTITDQTDDIGILTIAGPNAMKLLQKCTDMDFSTFKWLTAQECNIGTIQTRFLRLSYTGELAFELHAPIARLGDLWQTLWQAGQEFSIMPFGSQALDSLRLEKAYRGGHEMANDANPAMLDMLRLVDFSKDFIGKQKLQEIRDNGLNTSQLVYLELPDKDAHLLGSEAIFANDDDKKMVGSISSYAYGHFTDKNLAMGFVNPKILADNPKLEISCLGEMVKAEILSDAVHDPKNLRMKAVATKFDVEWDE